MQNNSAFRRERIENPWPRPASPRQRGVETKAKGVLQGEEGGRGARRVVSGIHRDADGFHPSRRQKREKERKLGEGKGRDVRSGREREREMIIGGCCRCCCCCCRCCARARAFYCVPLYAFGLSITAPSAPRSPFPTRGARTRAYGRPIAVLPLSLDEECEYTCIHFCAYVRVGEIAFGVRNGACAPYTAFYFSTKKGIKVKPRVPKVRFPGLNTNDNRALNHR